MIRNIDLETIYFEFDQFNITAEAAFELDKVIQTNKYPKMDILVESHTDIRGSESYNQRLSERRAKATGRLFDRKWKPGLAVMG